ncbi:MAG: response regulator transcription factor [Roseateles sp.]|nr:MAG: response regulator transcription factor [Roseateles sp.]
MTRILIIDNHPLIREGLKRLLEGHPTLQVVGEAGDGYGALHRLMAGPVDLAIVDISLPGLSDVELISRLRAQRPGLRVLVLSLHGHVAIAQRALCAGANGYLTKDMAPELILASIEKVAEGGRALSPLLAEALAFESLQQRRGQDALSAREQEVLEGLANGESLGAIAVRLGISHKTVSTHKANLMTKMGFNSMADLFRYAIAQGLCLAEVQG